MQSNRELETGVLLRQCNYAANTCTQSEYCMLYSSVF